MYVYITSVIILIYIKDWYKCNIRTDKNIKYN